MRFYGYFRTEKRILPKENFKKKVLIKTLDFT